MHGEVNRAFAHLVGLILCIRRHVMMRCTYSMLSHIGTAVVLLNSEPVLVQVLRPC